MVTDTCESVICPRSEACSVTDSGPVCDCPVCKVEDMNTGEVCSSKGNTFPSRCALLKQACRAKSDEKVESEGPCAKGKA